MKRNIIWIFFTLVNFCAQAQEDSIQQRIFLIGDGGELHDGKQVVVDWLTKNVDWNDTRNAAIYLGDNIYPLGLPLEGEPDYSYYKKIIDSQIDLVRGKKSQAFFVMGNHDWANGKLYGWQRAINQIDYINGLEQKNITAQPTDGCPGPVPIELNDKVVLVMMDSEWFLYLHDKPGPGSSCASKTVDEFATELREIAAAHPNQLLVLVMHHPMYSHGTHGGDYTWKEHLFPFTAMNPKLWIPLPVLGSVYPITRGVFGNVQDIKHPLYQNMVQTIEPILQEHPNAIAVAGHEHNLQLIEKDSLHYIVSGSGAKLTRLSERGKAGKLLFSDLNFGFTLLEVRKSGKVEVRFYNIDSKNMADPIYVQQLKKIDALPQVISKDSIPVLPKTVTVAANPKLEGNGLRHFFTGKNYREEWTTPIDVEVLNLGTEQGGLSPVKQGGGKQTRNLRLQEKGGKEWALRSIEKFPETALPPDLRTPFAKQVLEQAISASYPFAPLSIAPLARAAGLPPIRRKLVYIPDDPRLGRFRESFKNTLAVLEEREPAGVKKAYNTDELVTRLAKDNDDHVDQREVLKARLLDNYIMDFDRHEDQWQWATRDTGKGKIYYPIPRDHDQAFYVNEGLIPKLAKKPWFTPELQGFRAKATNIKTFNKPARNFDRFFLNELDWPVWERQIDTFLSAMTNEVLAAALRRQPNETEHSHSARIRYTLQQRKRFFKEDMQEYYNFISEEVAIVGTNQRELFLIDKRDSGKVEVSIFKIDKSGQRSSRIYHRSFEEDITRELRFFGLQDADSFRISGGKSGIKLRIIGGPGEDKFLADNSEGKKVIVHDVTFEENRFEGDTTAFAKNVTADPQENMYNRLFYKYNFFNPGLSIGYNVDDGVFLGGRLEVTRQGFRKEPYASRHLIVARRALKTSSMHFRWESDFTRVWRSTDVIIRADVRAPVNVTNFFGIGNNTTFDKSKPGKEKYYRVRYDYADLSVLARKQMQSWMRFSYGPSFQHFRMEEDENTGHFVTEYYPNGAAAKDVYTSRQFLGAQAGIDINSQNNRVIPTRGFVLDAKLRPLFGLNGGNNIVRFTTDMKVFASFTPQAKLVYALRLGFGRTWGNHAFQQAQYLSGTENLRGFRRDRFAGRGMLYNNIEVRLKLADFNTYLFPGQIGLYAFNDVGRVWADDEAKLGRWHVGNGIGIYISPVKRWVLTFTAMRSKEEKFLPMVQGGFFF